MKGKSGGIGGIQNQQRWDKEQKRPTEQVKYLKMERRTYGYCRIGAVLKATEGMGVVAIVILRGVQRDMSCSRIVAGLYQTSLGRCQTKR